MMVPVESVTLGCTKVVQKEPVGSWVADVANGNRVVCEDLAGENGAFCKILFSKIQFFSKKIHLTFW